jgi:ABC-2 type transport system ATP-binding protein
MDEAEILCDRVAIVDHGKVIALGTPDELIRSLGAEHVVEFAVDTGRDGADGRLPDAATLRALEGVIHARQDAGAWSLQVGAAHRTVPALLAELDRRGLKLAELKTQ